MQKRIQIAGTIIAPRGNALHLTNAFIWNNVADHEILY